MTLTFQQLNALFPVQPIDILPLDCQDFVIWSNSGHFGSSSNFVHLQEIGEMPQSQAQATVRRSQDLSHKGSLQGKPH